MKRGRQNPSVLLIVAIVALVAPSHLEAHWLRDACRWGMSLLVPNSKPPPEPSPLIVADAMGVREPGWSNDLILSVFNLGENFRAAQTSVPDHLKSDNVFAAVDTLIKLEKEHVTERERDTLRRSLDKLVGVEGFGVHVQRAYRASVELERYEEALAHYFGAKRNTSGWKMKEVGRGMKGYRVGQVREALDAKKKYSIQSYLDKYEEAVAHYDKHVDSGDYAGAMKVQGDVMRQGEHLLRESKSTLDMAKKVLDHAMATCWTRECFVKAERLFAKAAESHTAAKKVVEEFETKALQPSNYPEEFRKLLATASSGDLDEMQRLLFDTPDYKESDGLTRQGYDLAFRMFDWGTFKPDFFDDSILLKNGRASGFKALAKKFGFEEGADVLSKTLERGLQEKYDRLVASRNSHDEMTRISGRPDEQTRAEIDQLLLDAAETLLNYFAVPYHRYPTFLEMKEIHGHPLNSIAFTYGTPTMWSAHQNTKPLGAKILFQPSKLEIGVMAGAEETMRGEVEVTIPIDALANSAKKELSLETHLAIFHELDHGQIARDPLLIFHNSRIESESPDIPVSHIKFPISDRASHQYQYLSPMSEVETHYRQLMRHILGVLESGDLSHPAMKKKVLIQLRLLTTQGEKLAEQNAFLAKDIKRWSLQPVNEDALKVDGNDPVTVLELSMGDRKGYLTVDTREDLNVEGLLMAQLQGLTKHVANRGAQFQIVSEALNMIEGTPKERLKGFRILRNLATSFEDPLIPEKKAVWGP